MVAEFARIQGLGGKRLNSCEFSYENASQRSLLWMVRRQAGLCHDSVIIGARRHHGITFSKALQPDEKSRDLKIDQN